MVLNHSLTKLMLSPIAVQHRLDYVAMDVAFKVRWILSPLDQDRAGFCGTTTHAGHNPAAAALASAESVLNALTADQLDAITPLFYQISPIHRASMFEIAHAV